MRKTIAALLVGSLLCTSPLTLFAQETPTEQADVFKELTTEAAEAYSAGDYARAASLFQQAYELRPVSNILYNIARIHEEAGNLDEAISYYDQFIVAPNVEQEARRDAVDRLKTLREVKEVQEREEREAAEPPSEVVVREEPTQPVQPTPQPRDESNAGRTLGWVFVGAGAASLATSGVFALLAQGSHSDFESATTLEERRSAASAGRTQSVVADSLLITGLVTATIGGVVLLVSSGDSDRDATVDSSWSINPLLGPGGAGAAFNVRF